ncbi:DNA repair helicase rad25 [Lophium mytilinum]|uniref:DNA 3'-5' helicase n=1 Tax=Lophium mytilinum TaxID=390894 RepID=A0A6A6QX91_9PEZI|nr:DNA repair helicase rad25 [Lophium mytilinum]
MPPKRKAQTQAPSSDEYESDEPPLSDQEDFERLKTKYDVVARVKQERATHVVDAASHLFKKCDQWDADLKPDHASRPIWVDDAGHIIMESFSPAFQDAQAFLIVIAEPQSRVSRIHEYSLTAHSLFAAMSVGLTTEDIIKQLDYYSKTSLPLGVRTFIQESTSSFGKARIVLKDTKYFIESTDPAILQELLRDPVIAECRTSGAEGFVQEAAPKMGNLAIPGTKLAAGANQVAQPGVQRQAEDMLATLREDDDEEEIDRVHSFQIIGEDRERVVKKCREIGTPLTEEYDFSQDNMNSSLEINLKPGTQIRDYQERALNKMFGNGRARSGIIVLPCGAGKTLVGITAACTVQKSTMVLCTSAMSVVQWRAEFIKWSNINPDDIAVFTSESKNKFPRNAGVIISTYTMISSSRNRSYDAEKVMEFIRSREWGLLIADEVHVVPANIFKKVTYSIASHSKLGLTATLLREDDKIDDLNFLIGPKLYEANWQELAEQGHIAKVQCAEVWCQMTPEFYTEYLKASSVQKKGLLSIMNPKKFQNCQYLIDYHEKRGDKIIVFSDNVYALQKYAQKLHKAYIFGDTPQAERLTILENFQHNPEVNTIFLSKIGDTSLDLPEATCLIQISSHYGSRRQEAQRLGRILRAKRRNDEGFNAFFYSLVSKDTVEMYYSSKRQAFLVDQGYAFKVITRLEGLQERSDLAFYTPQDRRELLVDVLMAKDADGEAEHIDGDMFGKYKAGGHKKKPGARRMAGTLSELSGGQDMAYIEYNKSRNKDFKQKGIKNDFIRKLNRGAVNAKKQARNAQ